MHKHILYLIIISFIAGCNKPDKPNKPDNSKPDNSKPVKVVVRTDPAPLCRVDSPSASTALKKGEPRFDTVYWSLSFDQFHKALHVAKNKMRKDGWTVYKKESLDCDDYAFKLCSEIKKSLNDDWKVDGRGLPVGVATYNVDCTITTNFTTNVVGKVTTVTTNITKLFNGHAVVFVNIKDNNRKFYHPYPWAECKPIQLTEEQLKSVKVVAF